MSAAVQKPIKRRAPDHPASQLFPLMTGPAFDALVAGIETNGQIEPIVMLDGKILDGRNRLRACERLGIDPIVRQFGDRESDGDDPIAFVISENVHRRHLDESQRAVIASKLASNPNHRPSKKSANLPTFTQPQAAAMLNVGERLVRHARTVLDKGEPDLVAAVESGRLAVSKAATIARDPDQVQILEDANLANAPDCSTAIKSALLERRTRNLAAIAVGNAPLPQGETAERYPVIYADPPWRYEHVKTENRAIENHYPTMDLDAIRALPVVERATDDAILFLWATSPKLAEAMLVLASWGFTYRTCMVWVKTGKADEEGQRNLRIGMGYYARQCHELLLIATRGEPPTPATGDRPPSVIEAELGAHSAKPKEFAESIERMYPSLPKLEMFCRSPRDGWAVWGNQS